MSGVSHSLNTRPYAQGSTKDSVGEPLGILKKRIGIGRNILCWAAKGEALALYKGEIEKDIICCLHQQASIVRNTVAHLSIALYMVGKVAQEAVPYAMFVSDDKKVRTDAYKCVQRSKILEKYPGFGLGQTSFDMNKHTTSEAVRVLSAQHKDDSSCYRLVSPSLGRMATAGGSISYNGQDMLLTASYFLRAPPPIMLPTHDEETDQDDDCELWFPGGFSDDSDDGDSDGDEDTVMESEGTTELGSVSDLNEGMASDIGSPDTPDSSRHDENHQVKYPFTPTEEDISVEVLPIGKAKSVLQNDMLDYAILEVDLASGSKYIANNPIQLDDPKQIEPGPRKTAVVTETLNAGKIFGVLSEYTTALKCPWSDRFVQVYAAKFSGPIVAGDSGSWVRDATTGRLFGHVIGITSVSQTVHIMPAKLVFEHALDRLRAAAPQKQYPAPHDQTSTLRASLETNWEMRYAPIDVQSRNSKSVEHLGSVNKHVRLDSAKAGIDSHLKPMHSLFRRKKNCSSQKRHHAFNKAAVHLRQSYVKLLSRRRKALTTSWTRGRCRSSTSSISADSADGDVHDNGSSIGGFDPLRTPTMRLQVTSSQACGFQGAHKPKIFTWPKGVTESYPTDMDCEDDGGESSVGNFGAWVAENLHGLRDCVWPH